MKNPRPQFTSKTKPGHHFIMLEYLPANVRRRGVDLGGGIEIYRPGMLAILNPGPRGERRAPTQT